MEDQNEAVHRYEYEFDLKGDSAGARIVRMVKPASKVLDVGAGPGSIARELKNSKNCYVIAVDCDAQSLGRLQTICDGAYEVDLNDPSWPNRIAELTRFDTVIMADVLEHLLDPWRILSLIRDLLAPDGEILVSLPHVGHCTVMACLLNSDFRYGSTGLLDLTHLRFFGLRNIQSLFNGTGWNIIEAQFVTTHPDETELADQWSQVPVNLRDILLSNPMAVIYQVIVRAKKASESSTNLSLCEESIQPPSIGMFVRLIPNAKFRVFLKARLKSTLSIQTRRRIRRIAQNLGVRI